MRILFFGSLKEKAGGGERSVETPPQVETIGALIDFLAEGDAALKAALGAPSVRIAVDQRLVVDRHEAIGRAEEIAFLPPFSGG